MYKNSGKLLQRLKERGWNIGGGTPNKKSKGKGPKLSDRASPLQGKTRIQYRSDENAPSANYSWQPIGTSAANKVKRDVTTMLQEGIERIQVSLRNGGFTSEAAVSQGAVRQGS